MSDGYRALRSSLAAGPIGRDVVTAEGPEATPFLQGQISADVLAVTVGRSAWTWVLQPGGKVEVLARLTRLAEDRWMLDTDAGWGAALAARLSRFKLRTKVDLDQPAWGVVAVRGPDASVPGLLPGGTVAIADATWPGLAGFDLIGPAPVAPEGAVSVGGAGLEVARVEAGIPRMGAELTERTIPAETGLVERTVSFTKGCYTGQELVARIDSRGSNVARRLRGLRLSAPVEAGVALGFDGRDVGTVTSAAVSPILGPIALAYVRRVVEVGATVTVDGGSVTAEVAALPLIA